MDRNTLPKFVSSIIVRALTQMALLTAYCAVFGAISGWLSVFIALATTLLASEYVGAWWDEKGYDLSVDAAASAVSFVRGLFGKKVAA